jgi:hypothetical protein
MARLTSACSRLKRGDFLAPRFLLSIADPVSATGFS